MSAFLKGNFKVKREPEAEPTGAAKAGSEKLAEEFRKKALGSIGGSMVYVDRTALAWDGDTDDDGESDNGETEVPAVKNPSSKKT